MKTTAKNLFLTALTISSVAFAVDVPMAAAASAEISVTGSMLPLERLESDDQSFWDKFRDSVMKDKPEESEQPRVVDRKPVEGPREAERPKEAEKPKPVERRTVAMTIANNKKPIKNPSQQNNPSPPYQPVRPPYQTPSPPFNPGSTAPPTARK